MSEEYTPDIDAEEEWEDEEEVTSELEGEDVTSELEDEEEWEEVEEEDISPEEVESVVQQLDKVFESVESETIHAILTEAYEKIEELVDWEDEEETSFPEAA